VVKEIEKAAKAKKAKKEACQEAHARRKHSARKGKLVSKAPEEMSVLSVQAPCTCQGAVVGTIVRTLTLTMCLDQSMYIH